jgi:iron transport multicopper oxidase
MAIIILCLPLSSSVTRAMANYTKTSSFTILILAVFCSPVPPGASFQYRIPIQQHGTFWIHGHNLGQYVDGLRAPLILHNTKEVHQYDEEYTISLSDWYHTEHPELMKQFLSIYNPGGAEPIPDHGLINHSVNSAFNFVPGKTYRLRLICMSALSAFTFYIDGHDMEVIEVDGIDVDAHKVSSLMLAAAQRYSVLVKARDPGNATDVNYLIHADMDMNMFDNPPATLQPNTTATLVYNPSPNAQLSKESQANTPVSLGYAMDDPRMLVETDLVPVNKHKLYEPAAGSRGLEQHIMKVTFELMEDGTNHGTFNRVSFKPPKVPALFTALTVGEEFAEDPRTYGSYSNAIVISNTNVTVTTLPVIEIVLINDDPGNHPFHLHGHAFQVLKKTSDPYDYEKGPTYDNVPTYPMQRDTIAVPGGGYAIIRFVADNPGVWLFHCHVEWHLEAGLVAFFVERPNALLKGGAGQGQQHSLDSQFVRDCKALGIPYEGNAVGLKGLDLTGYEKGVDVLPNYFTAKAYVALAACVVSAFIGIATVVWFATPDKEDLEEEQKRRRTLS